MPEKLKDIFFTNSSIAQFGDIIKKYYAEFDTKEFIKLVFNDEWETKELKTKMRHTTIVLHELLPRDYEKALEILIKIAPFVKGFEAMVLPDYVELYGMDNWEKSLPALGHFTQYSSSEFAIRPYILKNHEKAMAYMQKWTQDKNERVRRFSSEGCRPRLPWAMALPNFKKDPGSIFPILEKLKDDESEFVRRSVANNLNDISKDNPDLALERCEKWIGQSERTDWIIKHACRSMLKAGNKRALQLFGYSDPAKLIVDKLTLDKETVTIGDNLHYSFQLVVSGDKECKVRLEYSINYQKAKGKQSSKIFKITENNYKPGTYTISRKQTFVDMSTRKHHEGIHKITIIANGESKAAASFQVKR